MVTELASSNEFPINTVYDSSEVIAKIEQLLLDAINQAEMILKQLPQYRTKMTVSAQNFDRIQDLRRQFVPEIADEEKLEAPLVLNERPGVRYLCCDRFFKCDGRNLVKVAREIWPSDGGCIELNRKELKRFIVNNEARRLNGSTMSRYVAGGSSREYITDNRMQQTSRETMAIESNIKSFTSIFM